jgi:hypothetical protein
MHQHSIIKLLGINEMLGHLSKEIEKVGMVEESDTNNFYGDTTILSLKCGGKYRSLPVIKLCRVQHTQDTHQNVFE